MKFLTINNKHSHCKGYFRVYELTSINRAKLEPIGRYYSHFPQRLSFDILQIAYRIQLIKK